MADAMGALGGGFVLFWLVQLVIGLFAFAVGIFCLVFWILMIVDVAKRKFPNENDKIMWVLIVVLTGIIGAVIYYFMIKRKKKK